MVLQEDRDESSVRDFWGSYKVKKAALERAAFTLCKSIHLESQPVGGCNSDDIMIIIGKQQSSA